MSVIKWRESFNVGVDQFDQEHRKILELINGMFEAIRDKKDKESVVRICKETLSYTEYHFTNEEKALQEVDYPDLEEQLAEHARLRSEAERFQMLINDDAPKGATEFYLFLREWLIDHILVCDKKYGPYFKEANNT
jgi:hemerythrin